MVKLTVATCQFPVGPVAAKNAEWITRQMRLAVQRGARVAHFPEGALSGYAGVDLPSFAGYDWEALRQATESVTACARELGVWVILGSAHRLSGENKPHNSLYIIDDGGQIVDRYDKRFCSGDPTGASGDLAHYSPGDHLSVWDINGIRCGALICYDYRFPELYREYKRQGVGLMFHSFHAANASAQLVDEIRTRIGPELARHNAGPTFTYPGVTMPATMIASAASSHVWISCSNSSARESLWPAFFVRADGITTGRLRRNVAGVLITDVDTNQEIYDSTAAWRDRAMAGVLNSGDAVDDPRSSNRTVL